MGEKLTSRQLERMPAPALAVRWERVRAAVAEAQERSDLVHAELVRRYGATALAQLEAAGRSQGATHVLADGLDIQVTVPGRDEIDQAKMAKAIARLEQLGSDWRAFVKVDYVVTRTVLKALPEAVRRILAKAVGLKLGKLQFVIRPAKAVVTGKAA